jgi:hypothetical protein
MQTKALRARVVVWIGALLVLSNVGLVTRVHAGEGLIEPQAGTWKTWVLASGSQCRLPTAARQGRDHSRDQATAGHGREA